MKEKEDFNEYYSERTHLFFLMIVMSGSMSLMLTSGTAMSLVKAISSLNVGLTDVEIMVVMWPTIGWSLAFMWLVFTFMLIFYTRMYRAFDKNGKFD